MNPNACIACDEDDRMTDSLLCYSCWQREHEAREYDEAGAARVKAALEALPFEEGDDDSHWDDDAEACK